MRRRARRSLENQQPRAATLDRGLSDELLRKREIEVRDVHQSMQPADPTEHLSTAREQAAAAITVTIKRDVHSKRVRELSTRDRSFRIGAGPEAHTADSA